MKNNVVDLGMLTRLDFPVDKVLEDSKGILEGAVIIGYDKEGNEYFASTYADGATVLWLLDRCKKLLLEVVEK